jgi:hypothetical protein
MRGTEHAVLAIEVVYRDDMGFGPAHVIDRRPADAILAGQRRCRLTFIYPPVYRGGLVVVERRDAAFVLALGLGDGDALALALQQQGALELGDCAHHRQHQRRARVTGVAKCQALLDESNPYTLGGQLIDGAAEVNQRPGQPVHAVHHHLVALADMFDHRLQLWSVGVLAAGVVGEHLVQFDAV